ncbi:hypothetical protein [Ralstonia sp. SET104]|jgi:ketosteroid isomerase-like protein|uniref:hypothetical protein n=1 Tax=Ralstonia sp. SET104 TaxID=2448774 RepID=UPI000F57AE1A|nr:hypothetical protein [Ralstonia sp. SET104]GCB04493.1 hypothetical protein PSUB009319_21240 [Ralstonia sp. SET104]
MTALENKQLLQAAFAELAVSNAKPFVALMADDFCWVCTGTTRDGVSYNNQYCFVSKIDFYGEWVATGTRPAREPALSQSNTKTSARRKSER